MPDKGVVVVRYSGHATVREGMEAFRAYAKHPDYAPGQRQLVDLSGVITFKNTPWDLLKFHALKVSGLIVPGHETLMAFHAPTDVTWSMANQSARSWEGVSTVIARVFAQEDAALSFLGLAETRIRDLIPEDA